MPKSKSQQSGNPAKYNAGKGKNLTSKEVEDARASNGAGVGTVEKRLPAWPALEPLLSQEDLELFHLLPEQIVTIQNFWTANLCKKYTAFLSDLPLTTTPGTPKKGHALRVNDRFQVEDPQFAEKLWSTTSLKDLVLGFGLDRDGNFNHSANKDMWGGEVVGLNPNIRIYRYRKGQFFDQHYDESNVLTHPGHPSGSPTPCRTTWTLLLYLTSSSTGCIGGETVFYPDPPPATKESRKNEVQPEPIVVGLQTGMALLHRHGNDCMLHEGREVLEGEKWVIRSDLCVKR